MVEMWKYIEGYESCYSISNFGRVKSLARTINQKNRKYKTKERIMSQCICHKGYHRVRLNLNGTGKNKTIHRLIAEAFIPNLYNLPMVNHIDGNKSNNAISNLEWCTAKNNSEHARDNNLTANLKGEKHPRSTIDDIQALTIETFFNKDKSSRKYTAKQLSKFFNTSRGVVASVWCGSTRKHLGFQKNN